MLCTAKAVARCGTAAGAWMLCCARVLSFKSVHLKSWMLVRFQYLLDKNQQPELESTHIPGPMEQATYIRPPHVPSTGPVRAFRVLVDGHPMMAFMIQERD